MHKRDAVLEIGTEEIPARFLPSARAQLRELGERLLGEERLTFDEIRALGTPRRLVLYVRSLSPLQGDLVREVRGPARRAAFDDEGRPTQAALGFARSQGVSVEELVVRRDDKGDYLYAIHTEHGAPAREVLARVFPRLIAGLSFPKSMRWGDREFRFARPIRWLLSLVGDELVEFEVDGIRSGRLTSGHRFIAEGPFELGCAEDYFRTLRDAFCLVDQEERKSLILSQVTAVAKEAGGEALVDEGLLWEVTDLAEYPTAFVGSFDAGLLDLPREVLITPMRWHQRYFPVQGPDGRLLAKFIGIRDGTDHGIDVVRRGNERVLRARLEDAKFFYDEDRKRPLDVRVPELDDVAFLEGLGSMRDKGDRIGEISREFGEKLGFTQEELRHLARASLLCKADLVTNMVREFTELQGVMGRIYAQLAGEPREVCEAIFEHYLPRFSGDELPRTRTGALLAIADKIDTLVGTFGQGLVPSGSFDPYGLRRACLGIIQVIEAARFRLSLSELIKSAIRAYAGQKREIADAGKVATGLMDFFAQRLRGFLGERGANYDVIEAVLGVGFDDILGTLARASAIQEVRNEPWFALAVTGFTRARNIAGATPAGAVVEGLLLEPAERELFEAYAKARQDVCRAVGEHDFKRALLIFSELASPIDRFFKEVLVMARDEALKANRLALLASIAQMAGKIADFSRIVISG